MNNPQHHQKIRFNLPSRPTLAIAFDFEEKAPAQALLARLNPNDCAIKIGKSMFTQYGPAWIEEIVDQGFPVFLDLKYHDIPNTVASACREAAKLGVWMVNVHAQGGKAMMMAAREAVAQFAHSPLLIAVTVLTSFTEQDLQEVGVSGSVLDQVLRLAKLAKACGLDGVVCSAHEAEAVKAVCGQDFLTVTPGIRLADNSLDDQKRVLTPQAAVAAGADVLVMGRAIIQAPEPAALIQKILSDIQR
jgi:orotidine-5'-phosphate decarboxylase